MTTDETYSVLIVDDSLEDRYLLKRSLAKTGLSLIILESDGGQAALDILTAPVEGLIAAHPGLSAPIALFLDINMPGMNGWEFLQVLAARDDSINLKPTIVVMYSTSDAHDEISKSKTFPQVSNYIVKGEQTPAILKKAILDCMDKKH